MSSTIETPQLSERERVVAWRREQAAALGLDGAHAELFALSEGDLHELERLIGTGCAPNTAAMIVS